MKLPKIRTENTVERHLDREILIYDLSAHKAYNLNATSSIVYQACDGEMTFDDLKSKHNFTNEIIYLALDELKKYNLLEEPKYVSPFSGMNRREVIKKVGLASMTALPVIAVLAAPTAAEAASQCVNPTGQAPNTTVKFGSFAGCIADCSAPTVSAQCCSGSARATMIVCDPGPPERTTCLCN